MKNSKAIFFDHDDTLVGTIQAKWAQHKYIARTFYGKELQDKELSLHWGKPLSELLKLLYETDQLDIAIAHTLATRKDFPKLLFQDTIDTLKTLRNSGRKVGLVTATSKSSLEYDFSTLKISKDLFDYVQTEEDTDAHKPDPRVFEPLLQWLSSQKIQLHEVVYVGDTLNDMRTARESGFSFIGVATGLISSEVFEKHNVRGVSRIEEILAYFQ